MKLNTKALADIEVGQPVIEDGIYHCRLSAEIKENKKKTGNNLVLTHEILDPVCKRDDGSPVNRGVKLSRYISMVPGENYDPNETWKRLATALELPEGEDLQLEHLQGAVVRCQVVHKAAEGDYPEGNDIKGWQPKEADFIDPQM